MDGYEEVTLLTPRRLRALGALALAALLCAAGGYVARQVGRARIAEARRELARAGPPAPAAGDPLPAAGAAGPAGTFFAAAAAIRPARDERGALDELWRRRPARWSAAEWRRAGRHLDANRAALAALHGATALAEAGEDGRRSAGAPSPWELFGAVRLIELGGHAALAAGDRTEAARSIATLARLAGLAGRETDLRLQMVALDARGAQLRVLREVAEAAPPAGEIAALAATLDGADHRALAARAARRAVDDRIGEESAARAARRIGRRAGPLWRALSRVAGELLLAEAAGPSLALTRMDRLSYRQAYEAADAAASGWLLGPFTGLGGVETELRGLTLRAARADAAAGLARLALALAGTAARDGGYPAALPASPASPDPLTGSLPSYRRTPRGGAVLALAIAEEKSGSAESLAGLPFAWRLPPPAAGVD